MTEHDEKKAERMLDRERFFSSKIKVFLSIKEEIDAVLAIAETKVFILYKAQPKEDHYRPYVPIFDL